MHQADSRSQSWPPETSLLSYALGASVLVSGRWDSFGKELWDAQTQGVGMPRLLWIFLSLSLQFPTTTAALPHKSGWTSHAESGPFPKNTSGPSDPWTSRPQEDLSSFFAQTASSPKATAISCHQKSSLAFQRAGGLRRAWPEAGRVGVHACTDMHAPSVVLPGLCPPRPSPSVFPSAPGHLPPAKPQHPQRFPDCCR